MLADPLIPDTWHFLFFILFYFFTFFIFLSPCPALGAQFVYQTHGIYIVSRNTTESEIVLLYPTMRYRMGLLFFINGVLRRLSLKRNQRGHTNDTATEKPASL